MSLVRKRFSRLRRLAAAAALTMAASAACAQNSGGSGSLECDVGSGTGMIITSSKALSCAFFRDDGLIENYTGTIRKIGVDIGVTNSGKLDWMVVTTTSSPPPGALAGQYGGLGASASVGAGLGANALVGGGDNSVSLQPFSAQGQTGLDLAAGVVDLVLEYSPPPPNLPPPAPPHPRRHHKHHKN